MDIALYRVRLADGTPVGVNDDAPVPACGYWRMDAGVTASVVGRFAGAMLASGEIAPAILGGQREDAVIVVSPDAAPGLIPGDEMAARIRSAHGIMPPQPARPERQRRLTAAEERQLHEDMGDVSHYYR